MPPEGDLNPYAAPHSNVAPPKVPEPSLPRPASTKWAIVVAVLFLIVYAVTIETAITHDTSAEGHFSIINGLDLALRLLGLIALLAGRRRPWGYYLSAMTLAVFWLLGIRNIWLSSTYEPGRVDLEIATAGGIIISLLTYLLYRFTFGQPSREFYQVSRK
jgi:hypothetical protein